MKSKFILLALLDIQYLSEFSTFGVVTLRPIVARTCRTMGKKTFAASKKHIGK